MGRPSQTNIILYSHVTKVHFVSMATVIVAMEDHRNLATFLFHTAIGN